jgi:putative flippase GtrA
MNSRPTELIRYVINGLAATAVHFAVLSFNLTVLHFSSAGAANALAACFGVTASFFGSRYFVFARTDRALLQEATRFVALYGVIAVLHGLLLLVWTDWGGLDYRSGFVLATILQVSLSYLGNKILVFR